MIGGMRSAIVLLVMLVCLGTARAQDASTAEPDEQTGVRCEPTTPLANQPSASEPGAVSGGIVFDEHVLTNGSRDEDYDGGGEFTLSGQRGGLVGRALDWLLGSIDGLTCPRARFQGGDDWDVGHAFASGLLIFTPKDLAARDIVSGDRPYASLFFLSAGRRYTSPEEDVAYDSTFTIGALGLPAAEAVQSALHSLTDSAHPNGWSHQISAGGEPTARYNFARQALLADFGGGMWRGDTKWTAAASAGTVTEGSVAVIARWGRLESPWSSFAPEENMYVEETQPAPLALPADAPVEVFAFAGARAKLRLYNAFLQGQFRDSDLTYGEGSLNQVLGEAWAGVEFRSPAGWSVQYLARWESPEMRSGIGSRSFLWGSIEVAMSLR
jgi:hypothetical protein